MVNVDLYNGDCFDIIPTLEKNSVDLICIDPPYGTTTINWDKVFDFNKMWEMIEYVAKPNANIIIFGSQPFSSLVITSKLKWFKYELIWNKNKCGSPGLAKYRPLKVHENIMIFNKDKGVYNPIMEIGEEYHRVCKNEEGYGSGTNTHGYGFGNNKIKELHNSGTRYPKSILHCSRNFSAQQTLHPTQKPTSLLNWLIMTYSNPGDVVMDFCMGSGSCGVSAKVTGRNFIGIEKEEEYFNISKNRISNVNEGVVTSIDYQLTTQISNDMKTTPEKNYENL
jgi:site-specific DNA-methyltransferase (adenine-specific)